MTMVEQSRLNSGERVAVGWVLTVVVALVLADVITDFGQGVSWPHLALELSIALFGILGLFVLIRSSFRVRSQLQAAQESLEKVKEDSEKWRQESKRHMEGLGQAIDLQFARWNLSHSEKEVALLLLKGLSLKEIASVRETSEKTARAQSVAVYQKSGLAGRSELAAFFLEDLLLPNTELRSRP